MQLLYFSKHSVMLVVITVVPYGTAVRANRIISFAACLSAVIYL